MTKTPGTRRAADGDTATVPLFTFPLPGVATGNGDAFGAWTEMNRSLLAKCGDLQQETVRFLTQRFEDDIRWQGELVTSRSPAEAAEIMAVHINKMITDYSKEARRLTEIATEAQAACAEFGNTVATAMAKAEAAIPDHPPAPRAAA